MTAFLWVMIALFVSGIINGVQQLSSSIPARQSRNVSAWSIILNSALLVWAVYLISK